MPKVSVIIPVYNVEKYLRESLESVVNQTLSDIEIICVDNASNDSSLAILQEYSDKYDNVKLISQSSNEGAGVARNAGLKAVTGEYIAFLDGDDFYELNFCEEMYKRASETNSDVVVCLANAYDTISDSSVVMPESLFEYNLPKEEIFNYKNMSDEIFTTFHNWNWNKIFKTEFVRENNIKFQNTYRTNDLYFTCVSLVLAERISVLKKSLVNYRIGQTTNSQSTNYMYPTDFLKAFLKLRQFLVENGVYEDVESSYLNWFCHSCVYNLKSISNDDVRSQLKQEIIKAYNDLGLKKLPFKRKIKVYELSNLELNLFQNKIKKVLKRIFSINRMVFNSYSRLYFLGLKIKIKRKG